MPAVTLDGEQIMNRLSAAGLASGQELDPKIRDFHRELLARFPPLESFSDADLEQIAERDDIVWSVTPDVGATHVWLAIIWPRASAVLAAVRDLAAGQGLVCYDPQASHVYNPPLSPSGAGLRLEACDGSVVINPGPQDIARMLRQLSERNWYAILQREPDSSWYVQVGLGPGAGSLPPGKLAVEHREGSPDRHFRCTVDGIGDVIEVFSGFASGANGWRTALPWAPLTLS